MLSKLQGLTIGALMDLRSSFLSRHDYIAFSRIDLAKLFVAELLGLPPRTSPEELAVEFRKAKSGTNFPINDVEFWDQISKLYLGLQSEPKDALVKLSLDVSEDLRSIDENLRYIESESARLNSSKTASGRLQATDRYYLLQLDYYKKKNLIAREEIVQFMARDIRRKAFNQACRFGPTSMQILGFQDRPYPYSSKRFLGFASRYDVRGLGELSNKLMDLPASTYREVVDLHKDSIEDFYEFAQQYIDGIPGQWRSVREKILDLVERSHILGRRRHIIKTMLDHYDAKDYMSFVSIAPLQVEGIFADVCRDLGIDEARLDISSLNDKLEHIMGEMDSFLFYEYYAFKFPVLRNLVAHGGLVDDDLARTSIFLLLDFLPVCELAVSEELPINRKLKLMDSILATRSSEKLLEWVDVISTEIPDFYRRSDDDIRIRAMFEEDSFWDFMVEKLESDPKGKDSKVITYAKRLKSAEISADRCRGFLASTKNTIWRGEQRRAEAAASTAKLLGAISPPMEKSQSSAPPSTS